MTPELISTCVIGLFIVALLAGFIFGIARGFNRSLIRLLMVVATLVITFFTIPTITSWVLNLDISNLGISVGGETATSVPQILQSLLNQIPHISDIAGTDAYATIMEVVPQMIINLVLFLVVFLVLRLVTMIIYWIIWGICFNKKKTEGKNQHRLLGSVVGLVQNFLMFLVILMPVIGVMNIAANIETIATNAGSTPAAVAAAPVSASLQEEQTEEPSSDGLEALINTANQYIDVYKGTWVAKALGFLKLDYGCQYVFDQLTTVTKDEKEYNLTKEVSNFSNIYIEITDIQKLGEFDLSKIETILELQDVINACYESKLTADLIDEVIPLAISKWSDGETFIGISKPTIEGYEDVLDSLLNSLAVSGSKQELLISTTNMVKSILGTAKDIVGESGEINVDKVGELLTELSDDPATLDLAKDVIVDNIDTIVNNVLTGEDEQTQTYKNMITETVEAVLGTNYEEKNADIKNEIPVIVETLKVAEKLKDYNPADETPVNITQEDANSVIEALDNSVVILETLQNDSSEIQSTIQDVIQDNADAKDYITQAINGADIQNKDALLKIFGLQQAAA